MKHPTKKKKKRKEKKRKKEKKKNVDIPDIPKFLLDIPYGIMTSCVSATSLGGPLPQTRPSDARDLLS
jgi:hypothetical protein